MVSGVAGLAFDDSLQRIPPTFGLEQEVEIDQLIGREGRTRMPLESFGRDDSHGHLQLLEDREVFLGRA